MCVLTPLQSPFGLATNTETRVKRHATLDAACKPFRGQVLHVVNVLDVRCVLVLLDLTQQVMDMVGGGTGAVSVAHSFARATRRMLDIVPQSQTNHKTLYKVRSTLNHIAKKDRLRAGVCVCVGPLFALLARIN